MPHLSIEICSDCERMISDIKNAHGFEAMRQASMSVVANCPKCSMKIPDELRHQIKTGCYQTREIGTQAPEPALEEKGRVIL